MDKIESENWMMVGKKREWSEFTCRRGESVWEPRRMRDWGEVRCLCDCTLCSLVLLN